MSASLSSSLPSVSALPETLPLFPLSGVVLLPQARLPLNIFEPRYISLIEHVLGQPGRMIGMVQPNTLEDKENIVPSLYKIGCAGRITSFNETEDGRYLINLTGICRFTIVEELAHDFPYRIARPDWSKYVGDLLAPEDVDINRKHLIGILENYFKVHGIIADWNAVQNTPSDMLISSLVMICPLPPNEKQALLEAPDLKTRADLLNTLLEMASLPQGESEGSARH